MNQYQISDYAAAMASADKIRSHADNLMNVFTTIDNIMDKLYGEGWQSSGASEAYNEYLELHKNYETFYNRILIMQENLRNITSRTEEGDTSARNTVTSATQI